MLLSLLRDSQRTLVLGAIAICLSLVTLTATQMLFATPRFGACSLTLEMDKSASSLRLP